MKVPEQYRVKIGPLASSEADGNNGYFVIEFESNIIGVLASDGMDWDHVSVSLNNRTPNWKEMCMVKDLFFSKDECVIQYHPSEKEYINNHPYCLHLWRPQKDIIPIPPSILVGIK